MYWSDEAERKSLLAENEHETDRKRKPLARWDPVFQENADVDQLVTPPANTRDVVNERRYIFPEVKIQHVARY